jgi:methyl coenzyme M reductase subunit D
MSESTNVSVTLGYTLNLGNFQSLRIDIGVTDFVRSGENTESAVDRVYEFVENKVIQKVEEAKKELED